MPSRRPFQPRRRNENRPLLVAGLIEPYSKTWKHDEVAALFEPDEVQQILAIPISKQGERDK